MKEGKWLPIESAPKDGTRVLLACRYLDGLYELSVGFWIESRKDWADAYGSAPYTTVDNGDDCFPTHWMPLPSPPQETDT